MKNRLAVLALAALLSAGCGAGYDDSALNARLDALDARIAAVSERLSAMNDNVAALGSLAVAYTSGSTVTGVDTLYADDGSVSGYMISFTGLDPVIIHNGISGTDGHIGVDGIPGTDGTPGHSPVVGVTMADGVWCWTVDGEILLGEDGSPCIASPDPSSAVAKDGETPVISIEDGNWVVTVGGSSSVLGPVSDSEVLIVDGVFSSVDASGDPVVFTLSGGESIYIPRAAPFGIILEKAGGLLLNWTAEGAGGAVNLDVLGDGTWSATVTSDTDRSGTISLVAPEPYHDASFMVLAGDGKHSAAASFSIISGTVVL